MNVDGKHLESYETSSANGCCVDYIPYISNSLYHYTSLNSFVKILKSGKLLFSSYKNVNDIEELSKGFSLKLIENYADSNPFDFRKEIESYKQISLCEDYKIDNNHFRKGFANEMMWAHYADRCEGVCLEMDKSKIDLDKYYSGQVKYVPNFLGYPYINGQTPQEFISKNKEQLFFTKHIEWEREHEFRIVSNSESSIDISQVITGIYVNVYANIYIKDAVLQLANLQHIPVYEVFVYCYDDETSGGVKLYFRKYELSNSSKQK